WVQSDHVARADQIKSVVWNETDGRALSAAATQQAVGLSYSSDIDIPSAGALGIRRAVCPPSKRAVPVSWAGLLLYISSNVPTAQNRARLSGVGNNVGRRRVAIRRAPLLGRARHPAPRAAHAFDHCGNDVPNAAAGCDRESTRDGIRRRR